MMNSKNIRSSLRWIFLLPGSIVAGILATFPLHWILSLIFMSNREMDLGSIAFFASFLPEVINLESVERMLSPLVISYAFIAVGYKIAPKHKLKTAITLFIIYLILWTALTSIGLSGGKIGNVYLQIEARTFFGLIGAIIGLYQAKSIGNEKKEEGSTNPLQERNI